MSAKAISFNNYDFQDENWRTQDIIYRNLPEKTIDLEPLSRRDGFRIVNSYYTQKQITISGTVIDTSEANLRARVDNMKRALQINDANLDIDDGGSTVRWTASVSSINIPEQHYHITHLPFNITFLCQPFGESTSATTDTNSVTTASETDTVVIIGSARPKPIITWTVIGTPSSAITGISFTNNNTSDTFEVTGLVLSGDGDYFELDTKEMTTVYNTGSGEVVTDFTGVIPTFITNTNSYTLTLTGGGASKEILQTIVYYASYL